MPENKNKNKNCHNCGLEALDDCIMRHVHIADDETLLPCSCCIRNLQKQKTLWRADFYSETWHREADHTPSISDPDPHERELLRTLHLIINESQGVITLAK